MTPETAYRTIAYEHIIDISEEKVHEILKAHERPIVFNFWMNDCPPCNLMKPKLRLAAREYHEKINIYSVQLTENSTIDEELKLKEIPTILIYNKRGKVVGKLQGLVNQNEIVSAFERAIAD